MPPLLSEAMTAGPAAAVSGISSGTAAVAAEAADDDDAPPGPPQLWCCRSCRSWCCRCRCRIPFPAEALPAYINEMPSIRKDRYCVQLVFDYLLGFQSS